MNLSWWRRSQESKSRPTTRRRPAHRLTLEPLEARELMTVQFTPTPFTTRPNSPDIDLGLSSFDLNFQINEPLVAVNPTNPANVAISSWDGAARLDGLRQHVLDPGAVAGTRVWHHLDEVPDRCSP